MNTVIQQSAQFDGLKRLRPAVRRNMRRGSRRSIRSRRIPIVRRREGRPRALSTHGRGDGPPGAHPARLRLHLLLIPPCARRPRSRKTQIRTLVVRLLRQGEAQVPAHGADFFVAVVAEVVVRVLTRGR